MHIMRGKLHVQSGQSPRRQSKTSNDRVRLFYASPAEVADVPKAGEQHSPCVVVPVCINCCPDSGPKKTSFVGNLVSSKSAGALHNHSTPSTVTDEDDEEAEEEAVEGEKQSSGARETANRFAKKLRSSFRFGKSKKTAAKTGGGQSENLGTRSVPQSPQTERAAISVAPPPSRRKPFSAIDLYSVFIFSVDRSNNIQLLLVAQSIAET